MSFRRMCLALAFLATAGCAGVGMGTLGDVLGGMEGVGGMGGDQLRGRVDYVDHRRRVIEVSSDRGRRTRLLYDSRTRVVYRDRTFPVSALDRGDRVTARVSRERRGELYARQIYLDGDGRDDRRRDRDRDRW